MQPTKEQQERFEKMMLRLASESKYAAALAAFKLGIRLGHEQAQLEQQQGRRP